METSWTLPKPGRDLKPRFPPQNPLCFLSWLWIVSIGLKSVIKPTIKLVSGASCLEYCLIGCDKTAYFFHMFFTRQADLKRGGAVLAPSPVISTRLERSAGTVKKGTAAGGWNIQSMRRILNVLLTRSCILSFPPSLELVRDKQI